ncbi:MAG: hypothetical protein QXW35_03820 [Candidatus Aenigmatarchaeota archaeon]
MELNKKEKIGKELKIYPPLKVYKPFDKLKHTLYYIITHPLPL